MRKLLCLICIVVSHTVYAQSEITATVTTCMRQGQSPAARAYLDSIIHAQPTNVEALFMKGKVIFSDAMGESPKVDNITIDDESIYSEKLSNFHKPTVMIPKAKAQEVELLWKKGLDIDATRQDIREALGGLYAMADRKEELLKWLPEIAKNSKVKGKEYAYQLTDLASPLLDLGDKEGAYAVFKKIAEIYPKANGVWCMLATVYRAQEDLANAKLSTDLGTSGANVDIGACSKALDIYTALGQSKKILDVLKVASKDTSFKDYNFYNAVYLFANHKQEWKAEMQKYIQMQSAPAGEDSTMTYRAAAAMLAPDFKSDYNGLIALLNFSPTDFYVSLIAQRASQDYKDSVKPAMVAARVLVHGRNYTRANEIFAGLESKKIEGEERIDFELQYAFSLYCAGQYAKSLDIWKALADIDVPYLFATSNYFSGQCHLKMGDKTKAYQSFKTLVSGTESSKFSYLARIQLTKLENR